MERNRKDIVAAAFAAAGPGAAFDPIRVQALLFLMDRAVSDRIGGPFFDFQPHRHGPFDAGVYDAIEEMAEAGTARIDQSVLGPRYLLTEPGSERGDAVLASFDPTVGDYFGRTARWVRLMPHRRMLAAIHREYPEAVVNGIVGHSATEPPARKSRLHPLVQGMVRAFDFMGVLGHSPDYRFLPRSNGDSIHSAWRAVGDALENAMVRLGKSERLW